MITDMNDHVPRFTEPIYRTTMSENYSNGASVTSVSATDKDSGENIVNFHIFLFIYVILIILLISMFFLSFQVTMLV